MARNAASNQTKYRDLRLKLKLDGGGYAVTVDGTESGATAKFEINSDWHACDRQAWQELGGHVGKILLTKEVATCLDGKGGKSRLWVEADEACSGLPFELAKPDGQDFLVFHPALHLVRTHQATTASKRNSPAAGRVLVAIANPDTPQFPFLSRAAHELMSIQTTLSGPECRTLNLSTLEVASPVALQAALKERPDVVHFIGHGDLLPSGGALVMHGALPNSVVHIYAHDLAAWLAEAGTRLVVLSACLGGSTMSGVAARLCEAGIPAVVAMQCPISDEAAQLFSRALYACLSEGWPIEEAVREGRIVVRSMDASWAAPVLYLATDEPVRIIEATAKPKHNLPTPDRVFIGRARELDALRGRLKEDQERLVTVTGIGGMGKTTLAIRAGDSLVDHYADAVWLVDCETLQDPSDLFSSIATAMQIGETDEAAVLKHLRSKRALLILDCFEQSVHLAPAVKALIGSTQYLQILVTSRILLRLPEESQFELEPLKLGGKATDASESIELFEQSARRAVHTFAIDKTSRPVVAEICSMVEGVPLAIVLAAGRLRYQSLAELRQDLEERLLATLRREKVGRDRHAILAEVIAGSYVLLAENDRVLIRELSAFAGPFDRESVAVVCALDAAETMQAISRLLDNSLLRIIRRQDKTRYKLLDTVREFLVSDSFDVDPRIALAVRRHAELFGERALEIRTLADSSRWPEATLKLLDEIANLRAAIRFSIREQDSALVSRFAKTLATLFFESGLWPDFDRLSKAALQIGEPWVKANILGLQGALASRKGDQAKAESLWRESADRLRDLGDERGYIDALSDLAWESYERGELDSADKDIDTIEEFALRTSNAGWLGTAHIIRARIALKRGDRERGCALASKAAEVIPNSAERLLELFTYQNLVEVYEEVGLQKLAFAMTRRVLRIGSEGNRAIQSGWALKRLAPIYEGNGELENACRAYLAAVRVYTDHAAKQKTEAKRALAAFKSRHLGPELDEMLRRFRTMSWSKLIQPLTSEE